MVNKMLVNYTVSVINIETSQGQSTYKKFYEKRYKVIFVDLVYL